MPDDLNCGEPWSGEDYLPPCRLPKGHDGDHATTVTWPQWEPRPPRDPSEPPSPLESIMQGVWGKTIAHALASRPVLADPNRRTIAHDPETEPTGE
jgi:hypothetical protein